MSSSFYIGGVLFENGDTIATPALPEASTTNAGVVQLSDSTSSTSVSQALTANQGYNLQQQVSALAVSGNLILAGTIDATTGLLTTVTTEGATVNFVIGDPLPSPAAGNDNFFVIVTVPGTFTPPGGSAQLCHQGDWFLSNGTVWEFLDVGFNAYYASDLTPGIIQIATNAEVQAGTEPLHAVTSSGLQSKVSDSTATTSSFSIASSTAVKTAFDAGVQGQTDAAAAQTTANSAQSDATQALADAAAAAAAAAGAIPDSSFTQAGQLIYGTGVGTYGTLALGAPGEVLTVVGGTLAWAAGGGGGSGTVTSITAGTGLTGGTITTSGTIALDTTCVVQPTAFTAKGVLLSASAASTPTALAVGTDGQVLTACSACATGLTWVTGGGGGASPATPTVAGVVLGCTDAGFYNTALGSNALGSRTTGAANTIIGQDAGIGITSGGNNTMLGISAGSSITSGCLNLVLGNGVDVPVANGSCQLALGWGLSEYWLTGDSTKAIKPGAGIRDCANSTGTAGQVLMSNGANAVCWGTAGGGGSPATPTVAGTVFGCTTLLAANGTAALGSRALAAQTTGFYNVAVGERAACALTSGCCNIVLGYLSGCVLTTGCCNVLIGTAAGAEAGATVGSVVIGHQAGMRLSFGCQIFIGGLAGGCNAGSRNIGIGYASMGRAGLGYTATGQSNVAIGIDVFSGIVTGSNNIGIGDSSGALASTGCRNISIGSSSLCATNTGCDNIGVGAFAGCGLSSGLNNTIVGSQGATTLTTGSNNIVLGSGAATATATSSNSVTLGNASITTIRAAVTTITSLSDERDKTDITALPVGLGFVNTLNPVKFTWQMREPNEVKDGTSEAGFIAQELQTAQEVAGAVYLGLVYDENPEKLEASPGKLIPVLVKAIQELSAKNDALETRLTALESSN